jgi:hypothetical protein
MGNGLLVLMDGNGEKTWARRKHKRLLNWSAIRAGHINAD